MDKNQLHKIFSKPFDHSEWIELLKLVFGAKHLLAKPKPIILPNTDKAKAAFELGSFTTSDDRVIGLYKVEVNPDVWLERNKVGLRELLRNVYKYDVDGALIVFEQDKKWRLSFVSEIKVLNEEGEVVKQATEPKRYTYLLGEGEKVLTPSIRLSKLTGKTLTLEDIRDSFSVEALNEEFYKIIADQFYQLIGGTTGKSKNAKTYDGLLKLPSVPKENRQIYQEFAVRLIGRTVFCWFLKVKKSDNDEPLLPENLLSSEALKANTNYYHTILEPLFFQTLNTPMEKRLKGLPKGCENIPFLNGGLFEYEADDFYKPNKQTGLSDNLNTLVIPDEWFLSFFSELEKYNFTIDENSVVDVEVSVDPEMLGRIFENLLAEIDPDSGETARKATGSFYTPREIVDYMATESLVQYLHNKTGLEQDQLRPVFKMTEEELPKFKPQDIEAILDALDKVKILDPACGSGAFPMGVLQKIVMALQKLDPESEWWIKRQIDRIENALLKKQIREKLSGASVEYARKIGIIQNSLFGVDIQPIAAEISKLRCFLTLIVDENIDESKGNRGIEPLPNLEFKFVTADTLLKLPEELDFGGIFNSNDDLEALKKLRTEYLQSYGEQKEGIKTEFKKVQDQICKQQISLDKNVDVNSRAYLIGTWNPFGHDKVDWFDPEWMFGVKTFDVVIGNPPYVQMQKDQGLLAKKYQNKGYETYERTGDVYSLFYERGVSLMSEEGNLTFISSDKWMRASYGKSLRTYFSKLNPTLLVLLGEKVFKTATVNTNILLLQKANKMLQGLPVVELKKGYHILRLSESDFSIMENTESDPWIVLGKGETEVRSKIEESGIPLKEFKEFKIYRGLITGLNEAFIIDNEKLKELNKEDKTDIFKPILLGKDIKRYKTKWEGLWLINSHNGYKNVSRVDIENYPSIKKHLDTFEPKLSNRYDKGATPYNLRNCAYLEDFEKEKIVWGNLATSAQFAIAEKGMFINAPSPMITPAKKYLLAILNSKLADFYIRLFGVVRAGGFFEYKPMFVEKLPIPNISLNIQNIFDVIVDYIIWLTSPSKKFINPHVSNLHIAQLFEEVIDAIVMELYFEEDFKKAGIEFIQYVEKYFESIKGKSEPDQIAIIHNAYQKLREKDNEIRNNLKLLDIKLADIVGPIKSTR